MFNQKEWGNFPAVPDADPPQGFAWDEFNGPAPEAPYNANLQYNWHHFWRYSGGNIVNDGIHQIDLARWLLGVDYPQTVYATGGRFHQSGAAETPDVQLAVFDFDGMVLSFELTLYTPYMLKISPKIRESDHRVPLLAAVRHADRNLRERGADDRRPARRRLAGVRPAATARGVVKAQEKGRFPDPEHKQNFLDCIRTRRPPNADIEEGHRSALLAHLANISYRLHGQKLAIDAKTETILGNDEAMKLYRREYRKPYVIEENV